MRAECFSLSPPVKNCDSEASGPKGGVRFFTHVTHMTPLPIILKIERWRFIITEEQKEKRLIKREIKRLSDIYLDIAVKRKDLAVGLIENAAFTYIQLKKLQEDIATNGITELFSQSENQKPYCRKRPEADLYNTMLGNYLKYIKQLNDMLPKDVEIPKTVATDGFDEFVARRDLM